MGKSEMIVEIVRRLTRDLDRGTGYLLEYTQNMSHFSTDAFLMHISQQRSNRLLSIVQQCKIRSKSIKKHDLISAIIERISLTNRLLNNNNGIVSVDIGTRNMAWVRGDLKSLRVVDGGIYSIESTIRAISSEFCKYTHEFSHQFRKDDLVVIEQQMQRHNIKCLIIESQLHAFLYPRSISISPSSVSHEIGHGSNHSETIGKKKMASEIAQMLINNEKECSLVGFDDKIKSLMDSLRKKDDLSDAIIQYCTFSLWTRKFAELMLNEMKQER